MGLTISIKRKFNKRLKTIAIKKLFVIFGKKR